MKKLFSILVAVVVMMCLTVSALALDEEPPVPLDPEEPYMFTQSTSTFLNISSNKATCISKVIGIPGLVTRITITQKLQKKNGNSWNDVATWTKTYFTTTAIFTNTKSSLSSGTYRVYTSAAVYNNTLPEFIPSYSTNVSC